MAAHKDYHFDREALNEQFIFSAKAKRTIFILILIGVVFSGIGIAFMATDSGHHEEAHAAIEMSGNQLSALQQELPENAPTTVGVVDGNEVIHAEEGGHHPYHWTKRIKVNLWINIIFFIGLSVVGVFWVAIQYISMAGWSAGFKRIPEAFAYFLPVGLVLFFATFFWGYHEIFHWTDSQLYALGTPEYDGIIAGKSAFLNKPFFLIGSFVIIGGWFLFHILTRKNSLAEDKATTKEQIRKHYRNMVKLSAAFVVFFGVTSSVAAWWWTLSIDTHWFSTMFGWYHFASWWVAGIAAITLTVVMLREAGYLKFINENHLHDLGKFVFAFSIFWSYIWFSQFLLIYYANIPEETAYYVERLSSPIYRKYILIILLVNFIIPFFGLMTRNAKRKMTILKVICIAVIIGHWFDFYQMITPGTLREHGSFGFLEIGMPFIFVGVFAYIVGAYLAKAPLVAKNHPLLEEAYNHET
ncbi:quinol:cytochrome C oxidoreductase [Bernardetia sp. ABR2-2B]|uniref:quinol:cytochrome C oxidoreductase n=1 Tax=Bernardetia sp. ABR2-2B TaxID=3127472 RepID=UPI0030CB0535